VRSDLPAALEAAIDRCLAKERAQRFANAGALIEALDAAQAAAPEIPLAIRLFANELNTLLLVFVFTMFSGFMSASVLLRSTSNLISVLPSLVLMAVMMGRMLQSRAEVRRIRADGFSPGEIARGLQAVVAEREARRQQLRRNADVVNSRRRTARIAVSLLIAAVVMLIGGMKMRYFIDGHDFMPPLGIALVFSALICFGLGTVLFARNPLKAPADERFFRRMWLSAMGRALLGFADGSVLPSAAASRMAPRVAAPKSKDARLDALEARVSQLEQRR
jgi:serine/threonine-protein kinase